jgi:hypothetical protein
MATLVGNIRGPQGAAGQDGATGATGAQGPEGPAGTGFNMRGTVADQAELEQVENPDVGDAYFVEDSGELYVWDGEAWVSMGDIRGPEGPAGPTGQPGANGTNGQDGAPGAAGPRGTGIVTGTGAPNEPIAGTIAGDLYLDLGSPPGLGNVYTLLGEAAFA